MTQPLKIGIVGGGGWLGGTIAEALLAAGMVQPVDLSLSFRSGPPARFDGALWTRDSQMLAKRSDIIILSVRPADWQDLRMDAAGKLLISVMAGIGCKALAARHETERVVRALPNAAAEVRKSYTPWFAGAGVSETDRATVAAIFDACGQQDEVENEADIDYLTGLSGSGPAFPALLAAAMAKDAINRGISRAIACRAANAVLSGAGGLLEKRDEDPAATVETFVDYNGTTAAAIRAMRRRGFDQAVADGLAAAFAAAMELGAED